MTNGRAHIIVVGNEKGGSGKSTAAMHLVTALMRLGRSVASIDLDVRQGTLSRYVDNRARFSAARERPLPMPEHHRFEPGEDDESTLEAVIGGLAARHAAIVIDTPGNDSPLNRLGHSFADTLVTPLNDSFVDLDVLAEVDPETLAIVGPSHYAEMVWQQKMRRAARDGGSVDWIVMRNRLSSLDAHNKREMARLTEVLARRIGFRTVSGFGERVIFRELFLKGLTMLDLGEVLGEEHMTLSHVAARQEVRTLLEAILTGPAATRPSPPGPADPS